MHVLFTGGAWTPEGEFLELPEFDMARLLVAWQDAVFELYLSEEKLETEVIENRSWPHCGFSVDQSVFLPTLVKSVRFGSDGNLFALETAATSVRVWRLRDVRKRLADLKLDWWMVPPGG